MGRSCVKEQGPEYYRGVSRHSLEHRHSKDSTGKNHQGQSSSTSQRPSSQRKAFFKLSGKGTHTAGTSIITKASRPVCQARLMWPLDQVLFLASAALIPLLFLLPLLNKLADACFMYYKLSAICLLICFGICFKQYSSICEVDQSTPKFYLRVIFKNFIFVFPKALMNFPIYLI